MYDLAKFSPRFLCLLVPVACGPESVAEYDAFDCDADQTLCVTLEVPEDYTGIPRQLATGLYDSSDTARPPDETLNSIDQPSIVAGEDYDLSFDQVDFEGEFYLYFILYDEAGGLWVPEPGIDYTALTSAPIDFDGMSANDLGFLSLELAD